ncbi:MAG: FkbM family methyltransferase [Acidimicrobiia bacterium]|nr:FkbM family methyltransferase [Acidimicrobiia bacterium]
MLRRFLHHTRLRLRRSPRILRALQWTGITRAGRGLYTRLLLRRGQHQVTLHGRRLSFAISGEREIKRLDSMASEEPFVDRLLSCLQPGDVVYDIGANIGVITVVVAASRPDVVIHAFEAEPQNAVRLRQNVDLNGLSARVTCHAIAVGSDDGIAELSIRGEVGVGTHSLVARTNGDHRLVEVPVRAARSLAREHDSPTVVKVDVEGGEVGVLLGMEPLLADHSVRELFIELHPAALREQDWDVGRVSEWLERRGYHEVWQSERGTEIHRHYRATTVPMDPISP